MALVKNKNNEWVTIAQLRAEERGESLAPAEEAEVAVEEDAQEDDVAVDEADDEVEVDESGDVAVEEDAQEE